MSIQDNKASKSSSARTISSLQMCWWCYVHLLSRIFLKRELHSYFHRRLSRGFRRRAVAESVHVGYLWADVWAEPVRPCVGTWWILIVWRSYCFIMWNETLDHSGGTVHVLSASYISLVPARRCTWTMIACNNGLILQIQMMVSRITMLLRIIRTSLL